MDDITKATEWDIEIGESKNYSFNLSEIWRYKDLLFMFIKRDIITVYKQTILGPIWFFLQPILTSLIFIIVFGNIAKISTDGLPKILFYLSGIIIWNYFSDSFTSTAKTFTENANIFGKVYFPRIILPLSKVISGLIKFSIQFLLFVGILIYHYFKGFNIQPNLVILLLPILLLLMAGLSLGFGIIFSSLNTKYRDLNFLLLFGIQLLMYATPVIYPVSTVPDKYRNLISMNPMSAIIETFRYGFLGIGSFDPYQLLYSAAFMITTLMVGIFLFSKVEKSFMDTV